MKDSKRILLIDLNDPRRETRIKILEQAGYDVEVRTNHAASELLHHEADFDLILLSLHEEKLKEAAAYSNRLAKHYPTLPILLLTDAGIFAPRGTLSRAMEAETPKEMLEQIAEMLAGSKHIHELSDAVSAAD